VVLDRAGRATVGEARDYLAALSGIPFHQAIAAIRDAHP
jgi:hypothetical protein